MSAGSPLADFLSAAHGPADIDAALEAASHGFRAVAGPGRAAGESSASAD